MRRSTWNAVLVTAAVLAVAGLLSRPGIWRPEAWRDASLAVLATLAHWTAEAWTAADALARQVPVPVAAGVTIGGGLLLVALGVAFRPRPRGIAKHRHPRPRRARRGRVALDALRFRDRLGRA